MGMFTTVVLENGTEVQFKTGNDACDIYKIGDKVNWSVDKNYVGSTCLTDGVYDGLDYDDELGIDDDYWVIIKDHVIADVIKIEKDEEGNWVGIGYDKLINKYDIKELPDNVYTKEAWDKYNKYQEEFEKKNKEFKKSISHLSEEEQFKIILASPVKRQLCEPGILSKIMEVEEFPEGIPIIFDKD